MSVASGHPHNPTAWRLCDADWNHWSDQLDDPGIVAAVAAGGFGGLEVGVYSAAIELAPARLAPLRAAASAVGLPIAMLLLSLPPPRWPDGALTGEVDRLTAEAVATARIAVDLGLDTIGLWPGADPLSASWADVVAGTAQVALAVAATGVRLAIEYKPDTAVPDGTAALRLAADVAAIGPSVGVLLDTGHAHAAGEDPAEVARRCGDLLWHVHLGDAALGGGDDDLPVGRLHDFAPFVAALDDIGYTGAASLDLYGAVCTGEITGVAAGGESRLHLLAARMSAGA